MSNLILVLSGLHLAIGCFIGGYFYCEERGPMTLKGKMYLWLVSLLLCLFGVEFYLFAIVYGLVVQLLRFIGRVTQIPFYWSFYLTKRYESLTSEQLKNIDYFRERLLIEILTERKRVGFILRHTLYTISLVYKRYNHKFKSQRQYRKEEQVKEFKEFNRREEGKWFLGCSSKGEQTPDFDKLPKHECGAIIPFERKRSTCDWCGETFVPVTCQAGRDGECYHDKCPQVLEGEPSKSGRSCPLWTDEERD